VSSVFKDVTEQMQRQIDGLSRQVRSAQEEKAGLERCVAELRGRSCEADAMAEKLRKEWNNAMRGL